MVVLEGVQVLAISNVLLVVWDNVPEPAHKCVPMIALMDAKKRAVEVANILVEAVVLIAICINDGLL